VTVCVSCKTAVYNTAQNRFDNFQTSFIALIQSVGGRNRPFVTTIGLLVSRDICIVSLK